MPAASDIDRVTDRTRDLVAAVSIPIFAQHVLPAITGEDDPERALRALRRSHAGVLCVTLGRARRDDARSATSVMREPGFAVAAVDTTGAGDVFRAAFIYATAERRIRPADLLRFANAAAAVSCTRAGAMAGVPTLRAKPTRLMLSWCVAALR